MNSSSSPWLNENNSNNKLIKLPPMSIMIDDDEDLQPINHHNHNHLTHHHHHQLHHQQQKQQQQHNHHHLNHPQQQHQPSKTSPFSSSPSPDSKPDSPSSSSSAGNVSNATNTNSKTLTTPTADQSSSSSSSSNALLQPINSTNNNNNNINNNIINNNRRGSITDPFLHAHSSTSASSASSSTSSLSSSLQKLQSNHQYQPQTQAQQPQPHSIISNTNSSLNPTGNVNNNRRSSAADLNNILSSDDRPATTPSAVNKQFFTNPPSSSSVIGLGLNPNRFDRQQPRSQGSNPALFEDCHHPNPINLKRKGSPPDLIHSNDHNLSLSNPFSKQSLSPSSSTSALDTSSIKRRNSSHTFFSENDRYNSTISRFSSSHPVNHTQPGQSNDPNHHLSINPHQQQPINPNQPHHHPPQLLPPENSPFLGQRLSDRHSICSSQNNGLQSRRESEASSCTSSSGLIDSTTSSNCTTSSSVSSLPAFSHSTPSSGTPSSISITMSKYSFPPPSSRDLSRVQQQQFFDPSTPSPHHISPLSFKRNSIDEVQDRLNFTQLADHQPMRQAAPPQPQEPPPPPPQQPQQSNPYSRAPELKISHKLAERKRRKEMRELFDELRSVLPQPTHATNGGHSVGSKWETLFRAVEFMTHLKEENSKLAEENTHLKIQLNNFIHKQHHQQQQQQQQQQHSHLHQQQGSQHPQQKK